MAQAVQHCGLDGLVVRPGAICGDSKTGRSNPRDLTTLFLRTCADLGLVPSGADTALQWIPVDFVAEASCRVGVQRILPRRVLQLQGSGPHLKEVR